MYGDECPRDRDIDQLQSDVSSLDYELRRTREDLDALEARHRAAIRELNELIGELSQRISELEN